MKLPNFVVVGAAKSGTTSLYHYLRQHPQVYLPERKELQYFTFDCERKNAHGPGDADVLRHFCATREEYEAHYADTDAPAVGEVSPSYFFYDEVASQRMREELGDVRIIILLRDPVEKAFSQYMHLVRDNRETLDFHAALEAEAERARRGYAALWRYMESSFYADRLESYLGTFGPDRVRVEFFQDFVENPDRVVRRLFEFLDIDPDFHPQVSRVYNRSGRPRSKLLATFIARSNVVNVVARRALPRSVTEQVKTLFLKANTGAKDEIPEAARLRLRSCILEDMERVKRILGRDPGWL
ncbi:MAG: sulfotransferase family protein [Vicinamibacteria bacterium]